MTKHDLADRLGHVRRRIFMRRLPPGRLRDRQLHCTNDGVRICAGEDVAAAFDRIREIGQVSQCDVRDTKDRTFLLYGAAVAEYGERILLKVYEIDKSQ